MNDLTGKVAVVTGASKGIGAEIARRLAAAGAAVAVNYSSGKDGADRVVADIVGNGGKAVAIQGNVSKGVDVKRFFAEAHTALGPIDVVVNNAGTFAFDPIESVTEAEFHREFDTNVLGTILTIQEALHHFPARGGSVINISSVVSENPMAPSVVYSATKGAIDTITMALAKELGSRNIRINTVAPGVTVTEGLKTTGLIGSDFETMMLASTPLGRLGQPGDIAPVVVFLASDDSAWLTGERISASGGLH